MLFIDARDKEKIVAPLFRTPRAFVLLVLALGALVAVGMAAYVRQVTLGLGVTAMDRPVYWSTYMVNFVFFIGISHAGTLISAILRVTGAEWRRPITRVAEAITVFALMVGTLQIIIDMGRPDRLIFTLLYGRLQSPILWDIVAVTVYFLSSITYLYLPLMPDAAILRDHCPADAPAWQRQLYTVLALGWRGNHEQWVRLEKAIAVLAVLIIPVAISVHSIISWVLATTVQPGWHSTIFGPYFVIGAIFSGIGALFLAMTGVRKALGLESYIGLRQYRNLGLLFIAMNALWFYFTYAEHLGIATGQQVEEFPVLASKLWGSFAPTFWLMMLAMAAAFWVLVVPQLVPKRAEKAPLARSGPRLAFAAAGTAALLFGIIQGAPMTPTLAALGTVNATTAAWVGVVALLALAGLGVAPWLKARPVTATVIASGLVLASMWLERWNIILPTMTHPRLIPYAVYTPSLTEILITVGSLALFTLLFVVFFKFFPSVSIWEVAEGRVYDAAQATIEIPLPPESAQPKWQRWGIRRRLS